MDTRLAAFSALHQQNLNPIYGVETKQIRETNQRRGHRISGAAVRRVCVSVESALASSTYKRVHLERTLSSLLS